jgi:hypothetical protein
MMIWELTAVRRLVEVGTDSGLVVFRDAEREQPCPDGKADEIRRAMRGGAADGSWFYLDAEDPVRYRIELYLEEQPVGLPEHRFKPLGGSFKLRVDSGRIVVSAFEDWNAEHEPVEIPSGSYALTVRGLGEFDAKDYDAEYRELLGQADLRYRNRVDWIGIGGCLGMLIAAAMIIIPFTRQFWYLAMAVLAIGWGPHLLLRAGRRYREIERRVKEYESSFPHFVVQLEASDPEAPINGGHLVIQ